VFNDAGTLTLNASAVIGNTTEADAGGILNRAGTTVLNASRVSGNSSESGAGIASGPGNPDSPVSASSLTLNGSRVDHNTATDFWHTGGLPGHLPAQAELYASV
jgi:hypothetical protein